MWRLVYCNLFVNINYTWSFLIRSADYFVDVVGISLKANDGTSTLTLQKMSPWNILEKSGFIGN